MTSSEPPPGAGSSRRIWVVVLAFVLAALGVATWLAVTRGMRRSDLYAVALTEFAAGDRATAESLLRQLLDANSENPNARKKLIEMLLEDERFEEARELAEVWTDLNARPHLGWAYRIEVELRQAHLAEAEKLARDVIDRMPELSLTTIVRVRDALGTYSDRWEAQKAAVHVATITDTPVRKSINLLFAAETILDIAPSMTAGASGPARQIARRYLDEALDTLDEATPTGSESDEARRVRARILLLSEDEWERESGEKTLNAILDANPRDFESHAAMATFYAAQQDWKSAVGKVQDLSGASRPYLIWLRAVRRLASRAPFDIVLPLLEASQRPDEPLFVLLRAGVLLREFERGGKEAYREQAAEMLFGLADPNRDDVDRRMLVAACRLLAASGEQKRALGLLERIPDDELDAADRALLGSGLGGGTDRAERLLDGLSGRVRTLRESIRVLSVLQRSDDDTVSAYLNSPITAGGDDGARLHLMRAVSAATFGRRTPPGTRQTILLDAAKRDLRAISETAPKETLADAFRLSLGVQEYELAGMHLGRALAKEGRPYALSLFALALGRNTKEADVRAAIATGIRSAAVDSNAERYQLAVADAIETPPAASPVRRPPRSSWAPSWRTQTRTSTTHGAWPRRSSRPVPTRSMRARCSATTTSETRTSRPSSNSTTGTPATMWTPPGSAFSLSSNSGRRPKRSPSHARPRERMAIAATNPTSSWPTS